MSYLVAAPGQPEDNQNPFQRQTLEHPTTAGQMTQTARSEIKPFKIPEFHAIFTKRDLIAKLIKLSNGIQAVFKDAEIPTETTISSTTKTLSGKSVRSRLSRSGSKDIYDMLVQSVYDDHLAKTPESIANKNQRDAQKTGKITFKDCTRFTVKLLSPISDLHQIEDLLFGIRNSLCDPETSNWRMVDVKYKIKANGYSDISVYFYTMFDGKPIVTEVQINTEACMEVKRNETTLYDKIKDLCINIPFENEVLLGGDGEILNFEERSKIDTDLVYTFFRSLADEGLGNQTLEQCITSFLNNLRYASFELVGKYEGIYLKPNQIPNFSVQTPSQSLVSHFMEMSKVFTESYQRYIKTNPVLQDPSQIKYLTEHTENLLQLPNFIDLNQVPSNIELDDLHPDIVGNAISSLEKSYKLDPQTLQHLENSYNLEADLTCQKVE